MQFDSTIQHGATSKIVEIVLRDSTTGQGKTGLAHGDMTASYVREGGSRTAITLASGTAGDSYSSGKWAEVDSTNCPGMYQLHVPNAAFASGADSVTVFLKATDTLDARFRFTLLAIDVRDAADLGLSRLDEDISSRMASFILPGNFSNFTITSDGKITVGTNDDKTGYGLADGAITNAKFAAAAITASILASNAIGADQLSAAAVAKIEAALLNEGDGQQLIDAIVQAIDAADIDIVGETVVRDAILNRVLAGNHDTAGTVGAFLQQLDALISSRSSHSAADVKAEFSFTGNMDSQFSTITTVTAKLDDTLEDNGGTYRFTQAALSQGPSSSGALTSEQDAKLTAINNAVNNKTIVVNSLQPSPAKITVVRGDTRNSVSPSGAIEFEVESTVKNLTGSTAKFSVYKIRKNNDKRELQFSVSGTLSDAGGDDQKYSFDLTPSETEDLEPHANYIFDFSVTLSTGEVWTPVLVDESTSESNGYFKVREDSTI